MTERPIFSECGRRPVCITVALCIVIGSVLLVAGCIERQPAFGNSTANETVTSTPSTLITQTVQTQCISVSGNSTPWIIINPISDHYVGDVFEINGTTDLEVNNLITVNVYQSHFIRTPRNISYDYTGLWKNITIQGDHCGINTWSFTANISDFNPEEYFAEVTSINPSATNRSVFKVLNASTSLLPIKTTPIFPNVRGE